ncbi:nuclear transport factor 2 family protein [Actinomadura rudentiformis]|uniref:Nuclear transport factor 2 family protein n=1 Tax=Actinomadura rudentiformis TaxID=359158 RepID=A0A6H9YDB0_9ACTN|nr:nuclear transport factor 2 family protein [Actinomadura rudentiformis]KAB2341577.1 nuclear transport factor 2 family protein [Actinomadura rudentiformis]
MTDIEERLAGLEARLNRLEDEKAVERLISSYGPLVDSGSADAVAGLWEPGGVYDVEELLMESRDAIAAMVRSQAHQEWISGGCAHVTAPPHVTVAGDEAVAVGYSLMLLRTQNGFEVRRATANRWQCRKGPNGWRIVRRTARILDGRPQAPALFADGVTA